jgi:23S rRNA pseudouridine2604 synthase
LLKYGLPNATMPTEDPNAIRLAKRLAADIGCSRAEAEQYIDAGYVLVDGRVEDTPGARVRPEQSVVLEEGASLKPIQPVTLVLHKPAGYTLRPHRPGDRIPSALDLLTPANLAELDTPQPTKVLPRHFRHLQFLLPMPIAASGLVVFSQDPRIIRHLTEDAGGIEQECLAEVRGQMVEDGLERLAEGLYVDGQSYPRIKASWQNETHLRLPLKNLGPEYVPNLCEDLGLQLISLRRLRIGRISLGKIPEGQWRYLQGFERF